ncbi:MAG: hypothetical protein ABL929_09830 [Ferruginibacter sp.]|nr:DUF4270 family protein [Ferruginibacter sp.]
MQNRFLPLASIAAVFYIFTIGCNKFDTTTQGADLLAIDNINTFADTMYVETTQGIFNDSTLISKSDNHIIGNISNDNLFGNTEASVYVQFKPNFYPFYFGNTKDTVNTLLLPQVGFDSAYIILAYKFAWGDTAAASAIPQIFDVYKITDFSFRDKPDTLRKLDYKPLSIDPNLLGSATITPQIIAQKSIFARGKDSVTNVIKIPINTAYGHAYLKSLFELDSVSNTGGFFNDSIFRRKSNGFEIKVRGTTGNTLYYVNLADASSRLEFVYKKRNNNILDTAVQSFKMYPVANASNVASSSSANYVKRDRSFGSLPPVNTITNNVFLQTSPGTFANIKVLPNLHSFDNKIIHRAFLIVEQDPTADAFANTYAAPPFLYLDLKDTVTTPIQRYKPVYFDLSLISYYPDATIVNPLYHPYPSENVDPEIFGGAALKRHDNATNTDFIRYEINLTRYMQHIVTNGYRNYDLRLYAPFSYYYPQYLGTQYVIPYFNPIAYGRVKVGGTAPLNHRMKVVVIYSKIP